jgi:hypothetical protein
MSFREISQDKNINFWNFSFLKLDEPPMKRPPQRANTTDGYVLLLCMRDHGTYFCGEMTSDIEYLKRQNARKDG